MKYATAALVFSLTATVAFGQSRQEKIDQLTDAVEETVATQSDVQQGPAGGESSGATPQQLLDSTRMDIDLQDTPAKLALEIWSQRTQVPLLVNWRALEEAGFDLDETLELRLNGVPAQTVLKLLVDQMNVNALDGEKLLIEVTEYYVRVMTKDQALRKSTTQMYFIGDLIMDVPNFEGPDFDVNNALSNTNSGGSNNGGGQGNELFNDDDDRDEVEQLTPRERAEQIADLIREMIEPEIWRANGGRYASIRYYRGMLIVRAPQFVHDQIGVPVVSKKTDRRSSSRRDTGRESVRSESRGPDAISSTSDPVRTVK